MSEPERARLIALADRYIAALRSASTGRLALSPLFRSTEDTQSIPPGTGIWRTIRGLRDGGHHPGDLLRAGRDLPIESPNSMLFTEVFKIVSGRIEEIWALGTAPLPYGIRSGW